MARTDLTGYDVDRIDLNEFPEIKEFEGIVDLLCRLNRDWAGGFKVISIDDGVMEIRADRYWETCIGMQSYVPDFPEGYLKEYFRDDERFGRRLLDDNEDTFTEECDHREAFHAETQLRRWAKKLRNCVKKNLSFKNGDVSMSDPYNDGGTLLWVDLDITVTRENRGQVEELLQKFVEIFGQ